MANRKRNTAINIRVTERERELIDRKYKASKEKTFTNYAIKALLYSNIYTIKDENLSKLTTEINRVGTNINQIAKRVNETSNIYKADIDEIQSKLNYLVNFVEKYYDVLNKIKEVK